MRPTMNKTKEKIGATRDEENIRMSYYELMTSI